MDDIRKSILGARALQVERIRKSISNADEVSRDEEDLKKAKEEEMSAEESNESEEEGKEEEDAQEAEEEYEEEEDDKTEKAHIMEALSYGNDIKVTKTGKEIKDQVQNVLIPKLNAELEQYKGKADELLKSCGNAPTKTPDPWWTAETEIEVPYKVYKWDETYIPENRSSVAMDTLSAQDAADKKGNFPENKEQAKARNDYNETVRMICNIMVDLKACTILSNLSDDKKYELTPRQVLTFGFDS